MTELGVGYISIVPEVSKISPGIEKALKGAEPGVANQGKSLGSTLGSKLTTTLKASAMGAGVAAGGFLAAGLTKGIGRLNSIEQAEAKLKGLGNSTKQVGSIMENALASVNGTAFGLEEAASSAAGLVAAGIKPGQQLETTLKTVADTATIAGTNMQDMGTIFGSVAARGKLQGDDMLQLLSRGVPVMQLLAEETGKTSAEISDMVSRGEIDFATFEAAMRRGMGGAALEAGNTVQGAFKNMWAAAGRLGANLAGPFFDQAAGAFTGITRAIDGLSSVAKPKMEQFAGWLTSTGVPALKRFGSEGAEHIRTLWRELNQRGVVDGTVDAFRQLAAAGVELGPALGRIGKSAADAAAALGISTWSAFVSALKVAGVAMEAMAGPMETVADFMEAHPGMVVAAVAAWTGFKTVPGILGRVTDALGGLRPKLDAARTGFTNIGQGAKDIQAYYAATGREISTFGAKMQYAASSSNATVSAMGTAFVNAGGTAKGFTSTLKGVASAGMAGITSASKGVINALGGPWGAAMAGAGIAIAAVADSVQRWNAYQEASENLAKISAGAYKDMFQVIAAGGDTIAAMSEKVSGVTDALDQMNKSNDGFVAKASSFGAVAGLFSGNAATMANSLKTIMWDEAADGAEAAKKALDSMGMSNDELASKITGSAGNWDAFKARLEATGAGGEQAARKMQELRDAHLQAQAQVDRMGPAAANASNVLHDLATKTGDAADRASKLRQAFMELRGVDVSATEAAADLTQEIDNLNQKMSDASGEANAFAGATLNANGTIDATTSSGAALYDALNDLGDSMQRSVASGNDANQVFDQSKDALERMRVQAGIGVDDWNRLLETMGMTPSELSITADVQSDAAKADLAAIANQVKGLGDEAVNKPVPIKINDEEAKAKLEQAGFRLQNWDEKTGTADLMLQDQAAIDRYNWWMSAGFPAIDMANPTAKANLDASGLLYSADYARMQLSTLDLQRPTPLANMDTSMLNAKQIEALNAVGLLDGTRPTPAANMNIAQLTDQQKMALGLVFDLDAKRPTPVGSLNWDKLAAEKRNADGALDQLNNHNVQPRADLDASGVREGAQESKSWIDSIPPLKTVSVVFRAVYEGFKNLTGMGGGFTGGRFAGEGEFARYADGGRHAGYRLPKSGPGTEVTDGFLAFDRRGVPAARLDAGEWVINGTSSQKYSRELAQINAGTFPKLPGYADGGRVKHASEIDEFARGLEGKPYVWGGVNWGDCSGAMAAIARFAVGLAPFAARFATGNEGESLRGLGFTMGRGGPGDLRIGWFNGGPYGGHTSGTLPNGVNVEMGGARGNGQYGGGAAGADHPQYTDHAYLPVPSAWAVVGIQGAEGLDAPGDRTYGGGDSRTGGTSTTTSNGGSYSSSSSGSGSQGPSSWSDVAGTAAGAFVKGQVADILGVFGIPDSPPALQAYRQYQQVMSEDKGNNEAPASVSDSAMTRAGQTPPSLDMPSTISRDIKIAYDPTKGAEQWRTTVEMALQRVSVSLANTSRTIEQIDIESGGDPNAQNNWDVNAANGDPSVGLLQVIRSTFEAHRDPELPDDQRHPLANIVAALNYTKARYGGPESIWPTRAGYRDGGLVRGAGGKRADAIPAWLSNLEFVVNAAATAENMGLLTAINGGVPVANMLNTAMGAAHTLATVVGEGGDVLADMLGAGDGEGLVSLGRSLVGAPGGAGGQGRAGSGGDTVVNNYFTAADPEEMYRMYRREASRSHSGRVGAR